MFEYFTLNLIEIVWIFTYDSDYWGKKVHSVLCNGCIFISGFNSSDIKDMKKDKKEKESESESKSHGK